MKKTILGVLLGLICMGGLTHASMLTPKEEIIVEKIDAMVREMSLERLQTIEKKLDIVLARLPANHKHRPILVHIRTLVGTHAEFKENTVGVSDFVLEEIQYLGYHDGTELFSIARVNVGEETIGKANMVAWCSEGSEKSKSMAEVIIGPLPHTITPILGKSGNIHVGTRNGDFESIYGAKTINCYLEPTGKLKEQKKLNNIKTLTYLRKSPEEEHMDMTKILEDILGKNN